MYKIKITSVFFGLLLLVNACKHQPPELIPDKPNTPITPTPTACDPDSVYFEKDILPLLISSCAKAGCHDANSNSDGVTLSNYSKIMEQIQAGNPGNSDLFEVITENDLDKRMPPPPNEALTSAQINLIQKWIDQGAKNNSCGEVCDTSSVTFSAVIKPLVDLKCKGCHNPNNLSADIDLSAYSGVKTNVDNGRLMGAINHLNGYFPMPHNAAKLPECDLAKFRIWIANGALDN